jgi:predicted lipoprotein with Yx(FWY)xxD motif
MKTGTNIIISLAVLLLLVIFTVSSWGQSSYVIGIDSKEGIGNYLVDSNGMTLYILKRDSQGKSTCTGECTAMWRPYYSENKSVPSGLAESDLLVISRDDNKKQITYKGMPLYYFAGDKKPGDTKGYGVYNIWFPASP